ncbi:Dehydrogenase/reductase SDR family member FEY, partial [Linum grandiflorum]
HVPLPANFLRVLLPHSLLSSDPSFFQSLFNANQIPEMAPSSSSSSPSSSSPPSPSASSSAPLKGKDSSSKQALGWIEWLRGWMYVIHEMLFQRILASHLENPMPLPPINDLTCIVTGSTSGIGRETARQLAEAGAHVVMAVRNVKAGTELIQKWQTEWAGKGLPLNIEAMELDLLSLESVVKFAEAWNAHSRPLNVLINNAGIFSIGEPQKFSRDGYEEHMQVNHLAPALLSILLLPSLIRGSPSRIVNVNSVMHYIGFVDTEDLNVTSGKRKYSSVVGYTSSKLAQVKRLIYCGDFGSWNKLIAASILEFSCIIKL